MNHIAPIEYKGQRVLLTQQLAEGYNVSTDQIKQNYSNNKTRYKEEVHFFKLEGEELRAFKRLVENFYLADKFAPSLMLWTERGTFQHAKSLGTDEAWSVYEGLVETYFRVQELREAVEAGKVEIKEVGHSNIPNEKLWGKANSTVRNLLRVGKEAGIDPQQTMIVMTQIYKQIGLEIPLGSPVAPKKTNDRTTIAKSVGLFSKNGEPHAQAVGAIISQIDITEEERTLVPYNRHGHPGQDYQYADSVIQKVRNWLSINNYPTSVSNGTKNYHLHYALRDVRAGTLN